MNDGFDLLIEKYFEGALSPEERADLKQMLAGDSALRAEYVARVTEEAALRSVVHGEGVQTAEAPRRARHVTRPASRPGSWIGWAAASAAAIFLILVVTLLRPSPAPLSVSRNERKESPRVPTQQRSSIPAPLPGLPEKPPPRPPEPAPRPPLPTPAPAPLPPSKSAPVEPGVPIPPKPPSPGPESPAPRPASQPRPMVARLESILGEVRVLQGTDSGPATKGQELTPGEGVQTVNRGSWAVVAYADGTRLQLAEETLAREIVEAGNRNEDGGKSVFVPQGTVIAHVAKQPANQPMRLITPHAEATVQGTGLLVSVSADETLVEVDTGLVRVMRLADRKAVDVRAGHYLLVTKGLPTSAKPLPPNLLADPGFERGGPGWVRLLKAPADGGGYEDRRSVVTDPVWAGKRALRFDARGYVRVLQLVPVVAGGTYDAAIWVKTNGCDKGVRVTIKWMTVSSPNETPPPGTLVRTDTVAAVSGSRDWTRHAGRYVAPPGAAVARFEMEGAPDPAGSGASYFDDASFSVGKSKPR